MTAAQIVAGAQRLLSDHRDGKLDGIRFAWDEYLEALNRSILWLVGETHLVLDVRALPLSDSTAIVTLPDDCLRLVRVGMNSTWGELVLPTSLHDVDLVGASTTATGQPSHFYRDMLAPNQIALIPNPGEDATTWERDSEDGLIRTVEEEDDGTLMATDGDHALRFVTGEDFIQVGEDAPIHDMVQTAGLLVITFVRSPYPMEDHGDSPDTGIPAWFHKDLKYAVAVALGRHVKSGLVPTKVKWFQKKWDRAVQNLRDCVDWQTANGGGAIPC